MHLYFDESGDYAFPEDRFDCYVQAVVIAADSVVHVLDDFVAARQRDWDVLELHATSLGPERLLAIAQFLEAQPAHFLAHVTDTELVTRTDIERHRLDQAAKLERNLAWYRRESTLARGQPVSEIEAFMLRMLARAGLASRVSHGEFIQAQYLIPLIRDALQKALFVYCADEWRNDSWEFRFTLDAKLPTKMAAGERFLSEALVPALGSQSGFTLGVPEQWKIEPAHPFVLKYDRHRGHIAGREVEGVVDLSSIFAPGLRFERSEEHAGLQLVDAVANVVRRAVLAPDDPAIQRTYDVLRPKLLNKDGRALTICRLGGGPDRPSAATLERYRALHIVQRV